MSYRYIIVSVVPFLAFFLGYFSSYWVLDRHMAFSCPMVIGESLENAVQIASRKQLGVRIIEEKIDNKVLPGTVLYQSPSAGSMVRARQTIVLIVAQQQQVMMPDVCGVKKDSIKNAAHGIDFYPVPRTGYSDQVCFTQTPAPNMRIMGNAQVYYAADADSIVLFPDLVHKRLSDVTSFLDHYGIRWQIRGDEYIAGTTLHSYIVSKQEPTAGTLIDLHDFTSTVYLYVGR